MTIGARLNAIITERKILKKALCEACGFSPSTLSTWIGNDVSSIPSEYIMPICRFFGLLPEQLLCDEADATSEMQQRISPDEKMLIDLFRQATPEGHHVVIAAAVQEKRRALDPDSPRARA